MTLNVKVEFESHSWGGVLDIILCDKFCQWLASGLWFSLGTMVSSANKTDCHNIAEILSKVALNTHIHLKNQHNNYKILYCKLRRGIKLKLLHVWAFMILDQKRCNKFCREIRKLYTDISCLGGVFAKKIPVERWKISRAEWRGKFSLKTGIFRKYPSQT